MKHSTPPTKQIGLVWFDVADGKTDRYICTMAMPVNLLARPKFQDLLDYLYSKRPSLRYRDIVIEMLTKSQIKRAMEYAY